MGGERKEGAEVSMTQDEIAAELERFWEWRQRQPRGQSDSEIWLARAEIAHAREAECEQLRVQLAGCLTAAEGHTTNPAKQGDYGWSLPYQKTLELRAEIAKLRERVRELAKARLQDIVSNDADSSFPRGSRGWWSVACDERSGAWLMQLAEEAGVWFDDDGNEVPIDKWRERMGGVR